MESFILIIFLFTFVCRRWEVIGEKNERTCESRKKGTTTTTQALCSEIEPHHHSRFWHCEITVKYHAMSSLEKHGKLKERDVSFLCIAVSCCRTDTERGSMLSPVSFSFHDAARDRFNSIFPRQSSRRVVQKKESESHNDTGGAPQHHCCRVNFVSQLLLCFFRA